MKPLVEKANALTVLAKDAHADAREKPLDLRLILRVMGFTKPYARTRNWLFLFAFIRAMQFPAIAWLIPWIINGPIDKGDTRGIIWGSVAFFVLVLSTAINFHFRYGFALRLGEAVVHDMRQAIFTHLQSLTMSYYDRTKRGWIISRMNSDVEYVRMGVQDVLFVSLIQGGQMIFAACIMAYYNWKMFLMMMLIAPVLFAIVWIYRRWLSHAWRTVQESYSRITATLAESISGVRVTQGFARQDVNAELFTELAEDHASYYYRASHLSGQFLPLLELNAAIFTAALLSMGGFMIFGTQPGSFLHIEGSDGMSDVIQFLFMAALFFSPVNVIGRQYNIALTAMAGAERLFKVLDTKPAFIDRDDAIDLPQIQGRVQFENLCFEYLKDTPVLREINFTAEPGQLIALVGHTGCGKTTLSSLIAKFYLPTRGTLTIDGHDITAIKSESLHRQMGIVLQQNFLFTGTVLDNIRMGKPDATEDEITDAARRLDVLDLIEALPEGFQTQVGETGNNLSLGQRQIVCFCRAMVANPRIMILDEATSSVDSMTEHRIQKALEILLDGRTSFVVAHRLSTIRHADVVLVLDHGEIVERGTHNALLTHDGVYANMYRQFISSTQT